MKSEHTVRAVLDFAGVAGGGAVETDSACGDLCTDLRHGPDSAVGTPYSATCSASSSGNAACS